MVRFALSRSVLLFSLVVVAVAPRFCLAADAIRAGAAISATFDDAAKPAAVGGQGVTEPLSATLVNKPNLVPSPFWNQAGKQALLLNATKKQLVELVDLPYLDRPDAVTLSFYFLSLHPPADANPHGLLGKRSAGARGTNYGINYVPSTDVFQVYINDGRGFRVATYSVRQALGTRRLAYLTATLEVGDAPSPDAKKLPSDKLHSDKLHSDKMHSDKLHNDVRVRLYVNGEPVPPKSVIGDGKIDQADAWLTKVNVAGLLNDAPLTLGSSTPGLEYTSGVLDEFLLFTRALTPAEVHQLFLEVAGPRGPELAKLEVRPMKPLDDPPAIESLSQFGLQIGQTTHLKINGARLTADPRVDLPIPGLKQTISKSSNARHVIVELTVPADAPPGIYPLSVFTAAGVSNPMGIAVDGLPQMLVGDSAPDRPTPLPAAFSGLLSGPGQSRIYFRARKGERLVAEVEARRIGSRLDPVLEVKTISGSTLAIEWGKSFLRGDARAEIVAPADGLYLIELHDLAYNAPGDSPFRLLLGDFRAVDSYFPPVITRGTDWAVEPVGTGIPAGTLIPASFRADRAGLAKFLSVPHELHASGPLPPLRVSDGVEILEVSQPSQQLQTVDTRFADKRHTSVAVNGRLSKEGETDRYLLAVTPGMPLVLTLDGRNLNSPVEGDISLYSVPDHKLLGSDGGIPGAAAKGFAFTVPAQTSSVEVDVRDLTGRGGQHFVYRLQIAPAAAPDFSLALLATQVNVPQNGRTMVGLRVDRQGYAGSINLRLEGAGSKDITIAPKQLPADGASRSEFVTLTSTGSKPVSEVRRLRIVGESVGLTPLVRRAAVIEVPNQAELSGFPDQVPVGARATSPVRVDLAMLPQQLYKGVAAEWPVVVSANMKQTQSGEPHPWVRLSLVSTEAPRKVDPNRQRIKPRIAALPDQALPLADGKGRLKIAVPMDVAEPTIDFVVKAEVVRHPYATDVMATTYSEPFRVMVTDKPAMPAPTKAAAPKTAAAKTTAAKTAGAKSTAAKTAAAKTPAKK